MSVARLVGLLAVLAVLFPSTAAAQSAPTCRFAHGGSGQTLSVALRGSPGLVLRVGWGDGESSAVQRALEPTRGAAYLTHEYAAPGRYRVIATAMTRYGRGCGVEFYPEIPFTAEVSADNRQLLPEPGAPPSSDALFDAELGVAEAEVAVTPPPRVPTAVERVADAVGTLIERIGGFLWGR